MQLAQAKNMLSAAFAARQADRAAKSNSRPQQMRAAHRFAEVHVQSEVGAEAFAALRLRFDMTEVSHLSLTMHSYDHSMQRWEDECWRAT